MRRICAALDLSARLLASSLGYRNQAKAAAPGPKSSSGTVGSWVYEAARIAVSFSFRA